MNDEAPTPTRKPVDDRQRERQADAHRGAVAFLRFDVDRAAQIMMPRRTTSMPTPRPERLLICSAVEKPGFEDQFVISSSLKIWSA